MKAIVISIAQKLMLIGALNFVAFAGSSILLGGDAFLGTVEGNRYFVGEHGTYTEVPIWVYWFSVWHIWSNLVTFPLGLIGALVLFLSSHRARITETAD